MRQKAKPSASERRRRAERRRRCKARAARLSRALSQAWCQSSSMEELHVRLAVAGASLEAAAEAWARENEPLLLTGVFKKFCSGQGKLDFKKMMESGQVKALPSKTVRKKNALLDSMQMEAVDSSGRVHEVRMSHPLAEVEDDVLLEALGGRAGLEAELAWAVLDQLAQSIGIPF